MYTHKCLVGWYSDVEKLILAPRTLMLPDKTVEKILQYIYGSNKRNANLTINYQIGKD